MSAKIQPPLLVHHVEHASRLKITALALGLSLTILLSVAASAISSTVNAPPVTRFKGTVTPLVRITDLGCAKSAVAVPGFFHFKTGIGGGSSSATARTCKSTANSAGTEVGFEAFVHAHYHKGPTTVFVNLTYHVSARTTLVSGSCVPIRGAVSGYYDSFSEVFAVVDVFWFDLTTGYETYLGYQSLVDNVTQNYTTWNATAGYSNTTYGAPGTFTMSGNVTVSHALYSKLRKHHEYAVLIEVYVDPYVSFAAYGMTVTHGVGSANVNLATAGNGIALRTLVET